MVTPVPGRLRAVVLVGNPVAPYSRAIRIARTLDGLGYAVEIAAVAAPGLAVDETGTGYVIRRYAASGPWARLGGGTESRAASGTGNRTANGTEASASVERRSADRTVGRAIHGVARRTFGLVVALRRWLWWPHTVRGWWATLARDLPPSDLYHACGSLTVVAALRARRRTPIGPSGRRVVLLYDAIDDVFESNNVLDMPRLLRAWHARRETGWARAADGLLTVNEPLADRLAIRWGRRPVPVPNFPDPWPVGGAGAIAAQNPGAAGANRTGADRTGADPTRAPGLDAADATDAGHADSDLLRRELGLPSSTRIVLFQGRLGPRLGLDEAAEAVLAVPDTALVLLGFGRGFDRERARDDEPRFRGRHFTLPARHPDELLRWTAAADVALVPLPPVSINQRLSSPNKFWEALAAGTPVVVPAQLTYMAGIVSGEDLGVIAASAGASDLAVAIATALERLAADPEWRVRIRSVAERHYSWPAAADAYREVVRAAAAAVVDSSAAAP